MLIVFSEDETTGKTTQHSKKMELIKIEKWLIDSNSNLSLWEKLERKLGINSQIVDPIDRDAENQCDWVDCSGEFMCELIRHNSRTWAEEQDCLNGVQLSVELRKNLIRQQAEYAKRRRDEQERIYRLFQSCVIWHPTWYSGTSWQT